MPYNELQKRKVMKKMFFSKVTLLLLLVLVVILGRSTWSVYQKAQGAKNRSDLADVALSDLEQRKEFLETSIDFLGTEEGVEAEIRSKFGVAKEGEGVITLLDPPPEVAQSDYTEKSLWEKILGFFLRD